MKYLASILMSIILLLGFFNDQVNAQIVELRQTVYGMDCAPCAHGLENRISNMKGVKSVSVSLNNSLLEATFDTRNNLTLREIQKSVEESGFQPKEAELEVAGIITKKDNTYLLETQADEKYILVSNDREIKTWVSDLSQQVIVTGKTKEEEEEEIVSLQVQSIEKQSK